ncbi:glycoside hydrolase family 72 protein [Fomitiporia mediterranea MF3/22]|uniref:glycoside hydrolase family 72 protein n=1 Tax=Fomitiporia mediterranea (strain MF3/22) TaxID=694068 RepID=UPI00044077C1|nr:glycoside hydrolase family 72 protein [Fomitiporia mediterranea MF3/22]EJD04270.1 glycoside hydrolase family 72 protein [Fomitiporia mediterranea MF3/22]
MLVQRLLSAALFASSAFAISKVSRAGRYLYTDDGNRFYIKGVAYQEQGVVNTDPNAPFSEPSTFIDPLSDGSACSRDLPFLQQLGVNTIRVYSVNSSLNHDACMSALSGAGIYTIIDLSLPLNGSIDRSSPAWTTNLLDLYIGTIDAFAKYDNVLAYNVGNEVITSANETATAPFIKAAARDIKAYLKSKNLNILVGYAAIDADRSWLDPLANFFSCDSDADSLDIFGLNNYEWCGNDNFESAYADVEGHFAGYNIPAYFSEYGCITSPPRLWTEVQALFSTQMSPVWSGGIAFSYFPAQSDQGQFGMVTISGNTVTPNDDFTRLAQQYGNATGPNTPTQSGAGSTQFPACPAQNSSFFASTTLPPTPNDTACACVVNSLSCQFTPQTTNTTVLVGDLLNTACGLLGQNGGTCNDIAGSGSSGSYGRMAFCDPASKLSFVMTQFYEATSRNAASCDFAGNATVNSRAPSNTNDENNAVSSCLANTDVTFTPTAPAGGSSGGGGSGGSGSSTTSPSSALGHTTFLADLKTGTLGTGLLLSVMVATGFWTLA